MLADARTIVNSTRSDGGHDSAGERIAAGESLAGEAYDVADEPPAHKEVEVQEAGDNRKNSRTEPPKTRGRGLLGNALANWGVFLYVAGMSFFLSPYMLMRLRVEAKVA